MIKVFISMIIDNLIRILFTESITERKIRLEKERLEMADCWNINNLGENK